MSLLQLRVETELEILLAIQFQPEQEKNSGAQKAPFEMKCDTLNGMWLRRIVWLYLGRAQDEAGSAEKLDSNHWQYPPWQLLQPPYCSEQAIAHEQCIKTYEIDHF